jgi:hypothetical protein
MIAIRHLFPAIRHFLGGMRASSTFLAVGNSGCWPFVAYHGGCGGMFHLRCPAVTGAR